MYDAIIVSFILKLGFFFILYYFLRIFFKTTTEIKLCKISTVINGIVALIFIKKINFNIEKLRYTTLQGLARNNNNTLVNYKRFLFDRGDRSVIIRILYVTEVYPRG